MVSQIIILSFKLSIALSGGPFVGDYTGSRVPDRSPLPGRHSPGRSRHQIQISVRTQPVRPNCGLTPWNKLPGIDYYVTMALYEIYDISNVMTTNIPNRSRFASATHIRFITRSSALPHISRLAPKDYASHRFAKSQEILQGLLAAEHSEIFDHLPMIWVSLNRFAINSSPSISHP